VLTDLAGAALVAMVWATLLGRALFGDPALRPSARRAGLLFGAVVAVVVMVPAERSPWNQLAPGSVRFLGEALALAIFVGIAPFVLLELTSRLGDSRRGEVAAVAVGLALPLAVVPDLARLLVDLTNVPETLWSAGTWVLVSVVGCVALPAASVALRPTSPLGRKLAVVPLLVCVVVLGLNVSDWLSHRFAADRYSWLEQRRARLEGLRWLREHTPEAGAFERSGPNHSYAVACAAELGPLVAYHGRRPVLGGRLGTHSLGAPDTFLAGVMAFEDAAAASEQLAQAGARYLLVERRYPGRNLDRESLAWRAATHAEDVGSRALPGFELVFVSPALSIWRVDPPPLEREAPSLRAGPR
jgi:hypothetical protein